MEFDARLQSHNCDYHVESGDLSSDRALGRPFVRRSPLEASAIEGIAMAQVEK
ncbi:hypothetical protein ZHAS_00011186 [Anopheles sinensis]|uniref:Uncharacterized protein n=1 Tax=Anopheles sinensis TaxID=74873 RepID=A0A084VZJ6_ANOSI|nr:hypothetical protein ZHAS_00011186 [Anopheles sinensis]